MISWLAVWFEDAARFLTPLLSLYESYIFASFFLLLCTWISPDPTERHRYFNDLERKNKKGEIISGGSLQWFHVRGLCYAPHTKETDWSTQTRWIAVMQFPAVSLIITIVVEITEAANVYCATSNSGKWAHIYCSIITALSTALAFTSVLQFYREVKVQLAPQKPLLKLVSIKGIVGLLFAQAVSPLHPFCLNSSTNLINPDHLWLPYLRRRTQTNQPSQLQRYPIRYPLHGSVYRDGPLRLVLPLRLPHLTIPSRHVLIPHFSRLLYR